MKKILTLLTTMALTTTASTSVIACDKKEPKPETVTPPKAKIDISNKISLNITLRQLSSNTKEEFLTKLHDELVKIPDLENIETSDYDVYKATTTDRLTNNNVADGTSLNIKIVARKINFDGEKDNITVKYTPKAKIDISNKISLDITLRQLSSNTKEEFLTKLHDELVKIPDLENIETSDYDVYKATTTDRLTNNNVADGTSLNIKIVARKINFDGEKDNITVKYTPKAKIDISNKISLDITLRQLSSNTKEEFLTKLHDELVKIPDLENIETSDYDVYKATTTDRLTNNNVADGTSLNIKIVARKINFDGEKDNITVKYTPKA